MTKYPAQQHQQQQNQHQLSGAYPQATPVDDERLARQLQAQYDRQGFAQAPVMAQPGFPPSDLPLNCGHCGMQHIVRHVAQNASFHCARCGRQNHIAIQGSRPVVVMRRTSWVPIPIFCNIQ